MLKEKVKKIENVNKEKVKTEDTNRFYYMLQQMQNNRWKITGTVLFLFFFIVAGINVAVFFNADIKEDWKEMLLILLGAFVGNLNKVIDIIKIKFMSINGQSKAEYQKNFKRVSDIVEKSAGDKDKAIALAQTQAIRITDEWKAINRSMAAKEMNQEHIFEVFFVRAYELGSVSKQDYRNYKLEKLGI